MKLLRHPVRSIREPFGLAGVIVACVALVAALGGGAYAASGGLSGKQKKEVAKIAQKEAKKYAGKPGATGPAGSPGAKGDAGAAGAAGKDGSNGTSGTNGTSGISPEGTPFTGSKTVGSVTCTEGGTEYKGANATLVCNGKKGSPGPAGVCSTPTCVLPSETTETGIWTWGPYKEIAKTYPAGVSEPFPVALSFPIPLEAEMEEAQTHIILEEGEELTSLSGAKAPPTKCLGSVKAPSAEPGNFCLYFATGELFTADNPTGKQMVVPGFAFENATEENKVGTTGTNFQIQAKADEANAHGTWAVTAE